MKLGEPEAGRQFLSTAILVAEHGLQSLPSWRERLAGIDQKRQVYLLMAESLVQSGQQEVGETSALLWAAPRNDPETLKALRKEVEAQQKDAKAAALEQREKAAQRA